MVFSRNVCLPGAYRRSDLKCKEKIELTFSDPEAMKNPIIRSIQNLVEEATLRDNGDDDDTAITTTPNAAADNHAIIALNVSDDGNGGDDDDDGGQMGKKDRNFLY
jgi:hypothetical protein